MSSSSRPRTAAAALVADPEPGARSRVAGLLRLTGWRVLECAGAEETLRAAELLDPDLVVVDAAVTGGPAALLRRLRAADCRAHLLVTAAEASDGVRAEVAAAGALACLPAPLGARLLLDFLRSRTTGPAAQEPTPLVEPGDLADDDLDAELAERLAEVYAGALPGRLRAIDEQARAGDAPGLASAAGALAGASGQLGHPEVAAACRAIAADARRGVVPEGRVAALRALTRR